MATLKTSETGKAIIKQARNEKGWQVSDERPLEKASEVVTKGQTGWPRRTPNGYGYAEGISEANWKRFLYGTDAIKTEIYKAFCQILGVTWEDVIVRSSTQPNNNVVKDLVIEPDPEEFVYSKKDAKSGSVFENFHSAQLMMDKLITESVKKETNSTDIKVIGLGGQYTWYLLCRYFKNKEVSKLNFSIYMLGKIDQNAVPSISEWSNFANLHEKSISSFKEENKEELARQEIQINVGRYSYMPFLHGILINERHLFLGYTYWEPNGNLEGLTVPIIYYDKTDKYLGSLHVKLFMSWWDHFKRN